MAETSTKPYMIRALYEWCCDNGYTPYLAVAVDSHTVVPRQHVKGGEIVLNVSPMATSRLSIGNEMVEFQARFSGVAQQISIPIGNISAIYARETGHGMAFDVSKTLAAEEGEDADEGSEPGAAGSAGGPSAPPGDAAGKGARSALRDAGSDEAGDEVDDEAGDRGGEPAPAMEADVRLGAASPGDASAESPDGTASAETAAGLRKRSARGQSSADVIAFAPGGAARKKGAGSRARGEQDAATTDDTSRRAEDGDDEPPPEDGGGKAGKGGKARLTRVK